MVTSRGCGSIPAGASSAQTFSKDNGSCRITSGGYSAQTFSKDNGSCRGAGSGSSFGRFYRCWFLSLAIEFLQNLFLAFSLIVASHRRKLDLFLSRITRSNTEKASAFGFALTCCHLQCLGGFLWRMRKQSLSRHTALANLRR